jgi:hypothetical protein
MSNKKQTVINWLYEQIDNSDMGEVPMWVYSFIEQAKEMEFKAKTADYIRGFNKGIETAAQLLKGDI